MIKTLEFWRPVKGFEGLYEVSNLGNVRSLDRTIETHRGDRVVKVRRTGQQMRPTLRPDGYLVVELCKGNSGKRYPKQLQRLVAEAFLEKPEGCDIVNHIDNNPLNNKATNLDWTTKKGNTYHARVQGRFHYKAVIAENDQETLEFKSTGDAERAGFFSSDVVKCCKGKIKTYKGYKWRYADDE